MLVLVWSRVFGLGGILIEFRGLERGVEFWIFVCIIVIGQDWCGFVDLGLVIGFVYVVGDFLVVYRGYSFSDYSG